MHAGPIEVLARVHAGGNFQLSKRLFVLVPNHQAGGERIVILSAWLEPQGLAKFLFGLRKLPRVHERGAEIVVSQSRVRIERNRFTQHSERFFVFPGKKQNLPQNAMLGRTRRIDRDGCVQFAYGGWIIAL